MWGNHLILRNASHSSLYTDSWVDDIILVLIGGYIRPNAIKALQFLVSKLKNECVIGMGISQ